ncbi:MAG: DNA polymerase I [Acidimicrobiales bacterium]
MATYVLLDGHSLAFRAWFALQEAGMATSSGQETQAVYGFTAMTTKLLADVAPDGMAVAFDRSGPTFRDGIADDYKAGRPPMPEPLVVQIELIRQLVEAIGVPAVDAEGFEADDVLGTLASRLRDRGDDVVVVTGDRDAYQLVEDPHVKVLYNRRGVSDYVLYDEAGIVERTGVGPAQYPLLAALRGDPSDNLPGVPGVGEKTAAKLVSTYGDLDTIYSHLGECTPKLRESLALHEARVRKNFLLTPIVRNVPIEASTESMVLGNEDRAALDRLFSLLEMRTPRDRLLEVLDRYARTRPPRTPATPGAPRPQEERALLVLDDPTAAAGWLVALAGTPGHVALEPVWSAAPGRSALEVVAVAAEDGDEVALVSGDVVAEPAVAEALGLLVGGSGAPRVDGHRLKELMRALLPVGVDLTLLDLDTAVAAYLVDSAASQPSLEQLAQRYGLAMPGPGTESEGADGQLGFDLDAPGSVQRAAVAARRATVAGALAGRLRAELDEVGARRLYEEVERPLVRVLAKMEVVGIGVDADRLREINGELTGEARQLEGEIRRIAGEDLNVNSTPQLRRVLYDKLKLNPGRKTKTGYSTDAATLEKLRYSDESGIVEALLRYREVEKLRSTYGDGLLAEVAPDGRIHATFNQTVARTGRLSSDQPNLHNIPVRTDEGRRFREAFVPAPGTALLVADYNQIELRVIAHLSRDPGLVGAFDEGRDIHTATAVRVFGVEPDAVTAAQRSKAKMISYGLAYGMEAYGLAQRLGVPVDEAAEILAQYFVAFPAVRAYMDATVAEARRRGFTETLSGRRRYIPDLASSNFRVRQAAERQAMNAGIQGLAADLFKKALVRLDTALEHGGLAARIVLQVHDEVLVEAPGSERSEVERLTLDAMLGAEQLEVPLEVHCAWGRSWADAKQA